MPAPLVATHGSDISSMVRFFCCSCFPGSSVVVHVAWLACFLSFEKEEKENAAVLLVKSGGCVFGFGKAAAERRSSTIISKMKMLVGWLK